MTYDNAWCEFNSCRWLLLLLLLLLLLQVQGLIIAVMYEKALGKKSRWEPYLSYLPSDMSHMPIYWTVSG